jgi:hypothetical protein
MLLSIPYQIFEASCIHLSEFQPDKYGRPIARLKYKDPSVDFQDVTILSPPVRIIDFNPDCNRLRVDLSDQRVFMNKLHTIQEYLVNTFYIHQTTILGKMYHSETDIRSLFHFLLDNNILSLYIYPTTTIKLANGSSIKLSELKAGDQIRFTIRLQGITQLWRPNTGVTLRFHHTVPVIWFLS